MGGGVGGQDVESDLPLGMDGRRIAKVGFEMEVVDEEVEGGGEWEGGGEGATRGV